MKQEEMPQTGIVETERLVLMALTPELYDYMFANWSDAEIMAYMGNKDRADFELEKEKYTKGLKSFHYTYKMFLMVEKETGRKIGRIGFHTWKQAHERAEIGYALHYEADKRKGYMTEAMKAVLIHGFEEMKLNRVEAFASPLNTPSIRLIEKYGFTKEGLLRQHYGHNGVAEDSAVYGLLASEYEVVKHKW